MRRPLTVSSLVFGGLVLAFSAITIASATGVAQTAGDGAPLYLPLSLAEFDLGDLLEPPPVPTGTTVPTPTDAPLPTPSDTPPPSVEGLALVLEADRKVVLFGEMTVITATFVNGSRESVTLIEPVDASTYGWRMPMYLWEVRRVDEPPVRRRIIPRCGNTNPLLAEDFLELAPGEKQEIGGRPSWLAPPEWHWSFTLPGTYLIQLRYVLDKADHGPMPPDVAALWREAFEGQVLSRPISIVVGSPLGIYAARLAHYGSIQLGWDRPAVETLLGVPDHVARPQYNDETFLVFWLSPPDPDDPPLEYPRDESYNQPRIVITLNADGRVTEALVLP